MTDLNYADFADFQQWKLNQIKRQIGIIRRSPERVREQVDIIEAIVGGPTSKGISDESVRKHIEMGEHFSWRFYQERER